MQNQPLKWWQSSIIYQVYPRSFADANGDGIGDLEGLIQKLDYLQGLGIGVVWLSPHYPSPMCDCGYDISDYQAVAPEYGTLDTFRRLLSEAHARGIRVVLDLVLNHTSDQHAWFIESRSSRDNPKRDWYVWRKGKDGAPPNNWFSTFGGPAWEYDPATDEYYYHFFFKGQPDLNWRNPQVKQAMFDMVRFWLGMGVDGFRLDAVGTVYEEEELPPQQVPMTLDQLYSESRKAVTLEERERVQQLWEEMFIYQHDRSGIHDLMKELRAVVNEYPDRILLGETDDITFYGRGDDELHLVFNFPLMRTDRITAGSARQNQRDRLASMPADAWPCNTLGNHDSARMFSQFGDGEHNDAIARLNLLLLLTLRGTPVLYNGEEIGMSDLLDGWQVEQFRDPLSTRAFHLERTLRGSSPAEALHYAARNGRDKGRTPLQWANTANAGFCPAGVQPWLPLNPDYVRGVNVADEERDPASMLHFYRRALHFRQQSPALVAGEYCELPIAGEDVLAFSREDAQQKLLVLLNFSAHPHPVTLPAADRRVLFSTHAARPLAVAGAVITLQPFEGVVLEA